MPDNHYNVIIVGCGAIGSGYDEPGSPFYLTHAHAFSDHPGFNLSGFVDVDLALSVEASKKWGAESYTSIPEAFKQNKVDVVVVAVPDKYHYSILKELSFFPGIFVLAEKPLTETVSQGEEIVSIFVKKNIHCSINFKRCFTPEFVELKEQITRGDLGNFQFGTGLYNKGLKHNGSHLLNLFISLTGENELEVLSYLDTIFDYVPEDPSYSFLLSCGSSRNLVIKAFDNANYPVFELDLHFDGGRVRILDAGKSIELYKVADNEAFRGTKLLQKSTSITTSMDSSMYFTAENIYKFLSVGEKLISPIDDGLEVMKVIENIITEIKSICQN